MDDLHGHSWKGITPEVHRELWSDWDEGFTAVQTALKGMASKIADAPQFSRRGQHRRGWAWLTRVMPSSQCRCR